MSAAALLSRLERVRKTGPGRWVARCPAHEDRSPSLNIREKDDGVVLVRCFAECATADILSAAGLSFTDLYPPKPESHHRRPERRPFHAEDVLRCLVSEAQIAAIVAARVWYGFDVDKDELDRMALAVQRIANGATAAGVDDDERRVRDRLCRNRQLAEEAA